MKVGIFGSTSSKDKNIINESINIGKYLSSMNFDIITGGVSGYPDIVAKSSIKNGGKAFAYGVGKDIKDHNIFHEINLKEYDKIYFQENYTSDKLNLIDNYTRSLNMCFDVDIAIIIGGRVGTMYEFTILSGLGKNIYVLENSGGVTGNTIKYFKKEGHKKESKIQFFRNTEELKKYNEQGIFI